MYALVKSEIQKKIGKVKGKILEFIQKYDNETYNSKLTIIMNPIQFKCTRK